MGFYNTENFEEAPVRFTVYIPRRLYEEAENAAKIAGIHSLEIVILK